MSVLACIANTTGDVGVNISISIVIVIFIYLLCKKDITWSINIYHYESINKLLDEVEQNIVICQCQADPLLWDHDILRLPSPITVLSFNYWMCFFYFLREATSGISALPRNHSRYSSVINEKIYSVFFQVKITHEQYHICSSNPPDGNAHEQYHICSSNSADGNAHEQC